jgi:hypothetical protein
LSGWLVSRFIPLVFSHTEKLPFLVKGWKIFNPCFALLELRNGAYNAFLDHVLNEKISRKTSSMREIVFRPIFHSKRDQEKNNRFISYHLIMFFLTIKHRFSNIKNFNLRFFKRGVGIHVRMYINNADFILQLQIWMNQLGLLDAISKVPWLNV